MDSPKPSRPDSPHDDQSQLPLFSSVSSPDLTLPASLLFRPRYQRAPTNAEVDTEYHSSPLSRAGERPMEDAPVARGLGITNLKPKPQQAVSRVPAANKTHSRKPSSTSLLQSPTSTQLDDTNEDNFQDVLKQNTNPSIGSSLHQPYQSVADTEPLTKSSGFAERPLDSKGKALSGIRKLKCETVKNMKDTGKNTACLEIYGIIVEVVSERVTCYIWANR